MGTSLQKTTAAGGRRAIRGGANEILDRLGGLQALADLTGSSTNTVRAWRLIGIPYKFWLTLQARAKALGFDLSAETLEATKVAQREKYRASRKAA